MKGCDRLSSRRLHGIHTFAAGRGGRGRVSVLRAAAAETFLRGHHDCERNSANRAVLSGAAGADQAAGRLHGEGVRRRAHLAAPAAAARSKRPSTSSAASTRTASSTGPATPASLLVFSLVSMLFTYLHAAHPAVAAAESAGAWRTWARTCRSTPPSASPPTPTGSPTRPKPPELLQRRWSALAMHNFCVGGGGHRAWRSRWCADSRATR